jgi:NTP pyrophosphatase (non-canonical NTP hydrolase)
MSYLDEETRLNHHSSGGVTGIASEEQRQQNVVVRKPASGMTMIEANGTIMPDGREAFLKRLRAVNVVRAREGFHTYDNVSILYFTTALAGEAGELGEIIDLMCVQNLLNAKIGSLCNLIKKVERHRVGGPDHGNTTKMKDITPAKIRDEIGGIMTYLDLTAALLGVDIEEATTETFNDVSVKVGSEYRL